MRTEHSKLDRTGGIDNQSRLQQERQRTALIKEVNELETLIAAKKITPEYKRVVEDSFQRMQQIAWDRMRVPVENTEQHAVLCGRFQERQRIHDELMTTSRRLTRKKADLVALGRLIEKLINAARMRSK